MKLVDKLHQANSAEAKAEKGLAAYIESQERIYGTLESRVKVVKRKNQLFANLEIEAEEIKKHGNIFAYEKRGKSTAPTGITEEQVRKLNMELADQRTKINDTCRVAHYSKEGIDQLLFQVEAAKKLLLGI